MTSPTLETRIRRLLATRGTATTQWVAHHAGVPHRRCRRVVGELVRRGVLERVEPAPDDGGPQVFTHTIVRLARETNTTPPGGGGAAA